jgi:aspartate-semialdehyde dehydrogenase
VSQPLRVALLGARDPLGEAVLALLEEREFELAAFIPLSLDDSEEMVAYAGDDMAIELADGFDWSRADVLIAAGRGPAVCRQSVAAIERGLSVIGLDTGVDGTLSARADNGLAVAATRALGAIARHAGLLTVDVFAALPVSLAGKAGVEELARQTQAVFAMEEADAEAFPVRMAFNLIPQAGQPLETGDIDIERDCAGDMRARLGMPDLPVMVTASWVPTFYGCALSVHGKTESQVTRADLIGWLSAVDDLTVMDEPIPGGAPTPFTESQEDETVFVGRIRADEHSGRHFGLWLVCDAIRLEAAQIVDWLENMIEKKAS